MLWLRLHRRVIIHWHKFFACNSKCPSLCRLRLGHHSTRVMEKKYWNYNLLVRFWISTWSWFLSKSFMTLFHWSSDDFSEWHQNLCTNLSNSWDNSLVEVFLFLMSGSLLHCMRRNPIRKHFIYFLWIWSYNIFIQNEYLPSSPNSITP